ncbi:type IV pili methyl-accepting chemotaxis transducer N-terminal domain-containing protein [Porticoccus hydrocarbonoclasticus]|uniref:type IV pili methyl-accepting chemotaxis transducer N-terminal domain-containing protein n=1 Tax=Porticoccus hydrocarbonoclasticus TaxID=1073414 RepID=UPI0023527D80|nr:histidine kinase [Porticoccus hydrocarbonoclasticus]|tara:strand:- start:287 stop:2158 length:1872 start_codon:yes stop_codon:yes gene_type:complete
MAMMLTGRKLRFSQSIAIQVLIPMLVIGLLALSSMLVSLLVTLNTQHDAEAINIAGSMRMQTYRIAVHLQQAVTGETDPKDLSDTLVEEHRAFSEKLYQSSIARVAGERSDVSLKRAYQQVVTNWEQHMVPLLLSLSSAEQGRLASVSREYLGHVEEHVGDIDRLVLSIQQNTEDKIELLGIYEGLSIFLSFLALVFIVMRTDQNLVRPLQDLVRAAEHTSVGDFSYRTYYEAVNEIGLLCSTFNDMSANLARHYRKLEDMVDEKTAQLQRSNQMLDFLYNTAQRLSEGVGGSHEPFRDIMADLKTLTGIPCISLCLANEANTDKYDLILPAGEERDCLIRDCKSCFMQPDGDHQTQGESSFAIEDSSDNFGFLYINTGPNLELEPWQQRLIEAVVEHLAAAMALDYREGLSRRVMLFEERSIIARELHDSLAQSLSYMKMQVARLVRLFDREAPEEQLREGLEDLQQGLNAAYRHLRELLTTFRLKLDAPSLYQALKATVDEFDRQSEQTEVKLEFQLGHCPLTPNEDIHVLQIIREAITNAFKHAGASCIELRCERGADSRAVFRVLDDGVGIASDPVKEHHYGLSTMRERAELLQGTLDIHPREEGGTEVVLSFMPEVFS